jgi:hypothetical protein
VLLAPRDEVVLDALLVKLADDLPGDRGVGEVLRRGLHELARTHGVDITTAIKEPAAA